MKPDPPERTTPASTGGPLDFLSGGGEMGARMRAFDWAATPLGPAAEWPQSLKTCVRIVLTSRQPMFVWWGDSLVNLYNDAYKSIVGGKHPDALGQPASVVWREIWDQVGPRAAQTMIGNEGTYDEALLLIMERNGYPEETYYTFSYSPVPNDRGGTGGIICANTEDTRRIVGERQIALLRELAARTADARRIDDAVTQAASSLADNPHDLPFALVYLLDADKRRAVLAGAAGIDRYHRAAPRVVPLEPGQAWPLAEAASAHEVRIVDDLAARFGELPKGGWSVPPSRAVAVPIAPSGRTGCAAVLVVGLNPFRLFDDDYGGFLRLVAGQIGASIANAQAYEEERRRAEALEELDRAKTAFFSSVSHEFRTPLTLILGPVEDALGADHATLSGENLRTVHRNSLRLQKLVNALLDFASIEAGRVRVSYERTDLAAFTNELASVFRSAVERAGLRFVVDTRPIEGAVFVDREMWEMIVLNLLSNALKFTFEGEIGVLVRADGDAIVLTVRDTGVGVAAAELPRLFERFRRVRGTKARTHEGSGIGLALVHELVKLHGGDIRVESIEGRGTVFEIRIPAGRAHLPEDKIVAERPLSRSAVTATTFVEEALRWLPATASDPVAVVEESVPDSRHETPSERIVLVDDNADMREYVARLLRTNWRVEPVADGLAALEAIRREPPDLVVSDVMMPGIDGFGLLRELRADPTTRTLPVILVSARAGEESTAEGLRAGANDYLIKPFSARELLARVSSQLTIAALRREVERERAAQLRAMAEEVRRRSEAEETLVALHEELSHRSEERFQLLVDSVTDYAIFMLDPTGRVETWNAGAHKTKGYRAEEIVGRHFSLFYTPEDRAAGKPERILEIVRQEGRFEDESWRVRKDGSRFWADVIITALRNKDGEVVGFAKVTRDLTERRKADENAAARRELESVNRAKDDFLAVMGHELRNPLAPMLTAVHLIKLRRGVQCEREIGVLERQLVQMMRLLDDVLDVSRLVRDRVELSKKPMEIGEVLANAVDVSAQLIEQKRHLLRLDVPADSLVVDVDSDRITQVFGNLLNNAAKYTDDSGEIRVRAESEGDKVTVTIEDTGIGIAPDVLPRIFELFVQGEQAKERQLGGFGVGLSVAQKLVFEHGGSIRAESDGLGRGSRFIVSLPRSTVTASLPRPALPSLRRAPVRRRVLIVDDNKDSAEMIGELLEQLGHEVRIALDGTGALELSQEFKPDIAFLDIGLPGMNGFELARRMRQIPACATIPMIAISGYAREVDRREALTAGFTEHFSKPIDLTRLERLVEDAAQ